MQSIYRQYDKGDISYNQMCSLLKQQNLEIPKEQKFANFKQFQKLTKQKQQQVPQITINLKHQLQCSTEIESPKIGRRMVTYQDSFIHKNENSYIFSDQKKDTKSMSKDSRLNHNNIYIEQKKKIIPEFNLQSGNILMHHDTNQDAPISPRMGVQSYRKNDSSVKVGNGLFSNKEECKKQLVKVFNKELKGNGNVIKNEYTKPIKSKITLHLESKIQF